MEGATTTMRLIRALSFLYLPILCQTAGIGAAAPVVQGTLRDEQGHVVAGVWVTLRETIPSGSGKTLDRKQGRSAADGGFSFSGLNPSQYEICVMASGLSFLDPCIWAKGTKADASKGLETVAPLVLAKGVTAVIEVQDPNKSLTTANGGIPGLILTVDTNSPVLLPARLAGKSATGILYDFLVPSSVPLKIRASSQIYSISDIKGNPVTLAKPMTVTISGTGQKTVLIVNKAK